MTRVLDVLEDYLDWRGYEHLRLDGAVSSAERGNLVKQFNKPGTDNFTVDVHTVCRISSVCQNIVPCSLADFVWPVGGYCWI